MSISLVIVFDGIDLDRKFVLSSLQYIFNNILPIHEIKYGGISGVWAGSGQASVLNTPLWTIPFEFFCYLFVIPMVFVRDLHILIKCIFLVIAVYFLMNLGVISSSIKFDLLRVFTYFLMGISIFRFVSKGCGLYWFIISIFLAIIFEEKVNEFLISMILILLILVLGFCMHDIFPKWKKIDLSYGVYIYAWPISQAVQSITANLYIGLLLTCLVVLSVAFLSYYYVEKPMLKYKKILDNYYIGIKGNKYV